MAAGAARRGGNLHLDARAGTFYERHGLVAIEVTDGAGNEEKEPDVRYVWAPADAG